jgi:hypothetical protein
MQATWPQSILTTYKKQKDGCDDVADAGEDDEGVAPRDVVVVGVEKPVAVPALPSKDA